MTVDPASMTAGRFVITRPEPTSGLGSNLLSMTAALYLAERTGRSLIVDWTGMNSLRDPAANYFVKFFEPLREWRGVRISYVGDDDPARDVRYDGSVAKSADADTLRAALAGQYQDPYLYLQEYHYYRVFNLCPEMGERQIFYYTRDFFRALTPRRRVRERLAEVASLFDGRLVVGLNVRTGNGHPLYEPGTMYWGRVQHSGIRRTDFVPRTYRACRATVARFPRFLWRDFGIFVVSDDRDMRDRLLAMPGAFSVRRHYPPRGVGFFFADYEAKDYGDYDDIDAGVETLVDMFLLARCDALVYNFTEFNRYPRYVTTFYNGNVTYLDHVFENPVRALGRKVARRVLLRRMTP